MDAANDACGICFDRFSTDSIICIKTPCNHVFCERCISSMIKAGSPTKRLSFTHLYCPFRCDVCFIDLAEVQNLPEIQPLIDSKRTLMAITFRIAHEKALQDNLVSMSDPPEKVKEIVVDCLKHWAFYECMRCRDIFFGGTVVCADDMSNNPTQIGLAEIPKEQLCVKCVSGGSLLCSIHGTDGLEWKCMFCCRRRPSTFLCSSSDYYCTDCHSQSGTIAPCNPEDCIFNGAHPDSCPPNMKHPCRTLGCVLCHP